MKLTFTVFFLALFTLSPLYAANPKKNKTAPSKVRTPTAEADAEGDPKAKEKDHLKSLQQSVDHLEDEVSLLRARLNTQDLPLLINYHNRTFLKYGLAFLSPRQLTFPFQVDDGMGVWFGLGQYFGENHVADVTLDWDLYPAVSFRYRYEFHFRDPNFNFAPVIGYKIRAASAHPIDPFISNPEGVRDSFFFAGGLIALPVNSSLLTLELVYLVNQQAIMVVNLGLTCFF